MERSSELDSSSAIARLCTLQRLNSKQDWVNRDLYRLLYRPEMFVMAYERVKSKPGNMTQGTDGQTMDGMSLGSINEIIAELKDESYKPKPARRVYIPKRNGKLRPLGIPSVKDKLVQEVVRNILDCIYDSPFGPTFSEASHGFREGRSTHTALKEVCSKWTGTKWFIEGDIKSFFDEIDHDVLILILRRRIADERFISLIRKFLGAGYIEEGVFKPSPQGTPQGGVVSPVLANIFLNEFDSWIRNIIDQREKGAKRRANPEYRSLVRKRTYILNKCKGNPSEEQRDRIKELDEEIRSTSSVDTHDPDFVRIRYVRYADDWLIGVSGSKALSEEIKAKATEFFHDELKLKLSQEKTKITHSGDKADFLGFLVGCPRYRVSTTSKFKASGQSFHTVRRSNGQHLVKLWIPTDRILGKLKSEEFIKRKGGDWFAISKRSYVHLDPDDIVQRYNAIKRGLVGYYRPAANINVLTYIDHLLRLSLAKTLAHKYRTSMKHQFQMRGRSLKVMRDVKGKVRVTSYWECSFKVDTNGFNTNPRNPMELFTYHRKVTKSKLGMNCCVCGSSNNIHMHHLRHLRKGSKTVATGFNKVMAQINRKQIPVCQPCHVAIHNGRYDGMSLRDLHYDPSYV